MLYCNFIRGMSAIQCISIAICFHWMKLFSGLLTDAHFIDKFSLVPQVLIYRGEVWWAKTRMHVTWMLQYDGNYALV